MAEELQQRPETAEERRQREAAARVVAAQERKRDNARILRAIHSNPHLLAFAVGTAEIVERAQDVGGNGMGDELPIGPLTAPRIALCDRVNLCRRVNELVADGHSYLVVPQFGMPNKEDAR